MIIIYIVDAFFNKFIEKNFSVLLLASDNLIVDFNNKNKNAKDYHRYNLHNCICNRM